MIEFDDVTFAYSGAEPTLRDVSFTVADGDLCVVVGLTGTGKSTLLGLVNGLVPHFTGGRLTGRVRVAGRSTHHERPRDLADLVGYVGPVSYTHLDVYKRQGGRGGLGLR